MRVSRWHPLTAPMVLAVLVALVVLAATPQETVAAETHDPTGLWLTGNERSAIRVQQCDAGLCGRVAWIIEGGMQYDSENPDPAKQDRPLCGLEILWGVAQQTDDPNAWENGKVYKADTGETFDLDLTMKGPDTMKVRGYRGLSLFGKSQIWHRVTRDTHPQCQPPDTSN